MRLALAILLGRLAGFVTRLFGRGGSALPGLVAGWIQPRTIERLVASFSEGVVVVTGTNGKTTTTKMLVSILERSGRMVVTNRTGSNLARGLASTLIGVSSIGGKVRADIAVFEVDEAAVRNLAPRLTPRMIVVTNLARDQLDRYGELQTTAGHVASALEHTPLAVLNADDPLVASLAGDGEVAWFGAVDEIRSTLPDDRALYGGDAPSPPGVVPDSLLRSHRPSGDGQVIEVSVAGEAVEVELAVPGAYNGYNAAAALLAAARLAVAPADAVPAMEAMEPAFGRGQVVERDGRRVKVLLVKNPASLNQAILLLRGLPEAKSVLVAINDEFADGRDVSWLWDARVEDLAGTGHRFGAGGVRAADMALRFKYAGVEAWAEEDFEAALDRLVRSAPEGDTVYVVPTYTAMLALLRLLVPGASPAEVWQ